MCIANFVTDSIVHSADEFRKNFLSTKPWDLTRKPKRKIALKGDGGNDEYYDDDGEDGDDDDDDDDFEIVEDT